MSLRAAIIGLRLRADTIALRLKAAIETGLFILLRTFADSALLADTPFKAFFKKLTNGTTVTDNDSLAVGKVIDPPYAFEYFAEDYTRTNLVSFSHTEQLLFGKQISDTPGVAEAISLGLARQVTDIASISDNDQLLIGKRPSDAAAFSDDERKDITKTIYEFYAFDYFAGDYTQTVTQVSFSDDAQLSFSKTPSDSIALAETQQFVATKLLADTTFATDDLDGEASTEDDQEIHFFKSLSHLLSAADDVLISPTKVLSDAASLADDGSARGQGYADFTYFSDDYVGYSWTF